MRVKCANEIQIPKRKKKSLWNQIGGLLFMLYTGNFWFVIINLIVFTRESEKNASLGYCTWKFWSGNEDELKFENRVEISSLRVATWLTTNQ